MSHLYQLVCTFCLLLNTFVPAPFYIGTFGCPGRITISCNVDLDVAVARVYENLTHKNALYFNNLTNML